MLNRENREWQRVNVDLMARCRALDGAPRYEPIRIIDMHHKGCCLEGTSRFQKGETVRVIVEIPFEGEVNITGLVAWSGAINDKGDYRTGLKFEIDSPPAEETCLKLYHYCTMKHPKG